MVKVKHRNTSKHNRNWFAQYPFNPVTALYVFVIFITFTFFMGGGARDDIQSLIILRPLAILFIGFAIIYKRELRKKWDKFPINMTLLLALLMIIQLIPLPPELWTQLPERKVFAELAELAGIEQPWRPISLSPSKTWNSLFSLCVPLAAMMLFMNINARDRRRAILFIMVLIALSAAWGILQTLGSSRGPLYLYRITNHGTAVGLFANRNHQSYMLVSLILFLGWHSFYLQQKNKINPLKLSMTLGGIFILIPLIFITGSRSGLILMVPALIIALYFFYFGGHFKRKEKLYKPSKSNSKINIVAKLKINSDRFIFVGLIITILLLAVSAIIFSRSLAFDRLFADNGIDELRLKVTPVLLHMVDSYLVFGSGFGSFEHIYKIYEPLDFLSPNYFNQAHNDWLQLIIEGGIAALFLLAILIIWIARHAIFILFRIKKLDHNKTSALMCLTFFCLTAIASIADYPIRVPIVMVVFSTILCYFSQKMNEIKEV